MGIALISIILATYLEDNQKYLDLCLNSIASQTYKDYEVILVSSGSYKPTHPSWVQHVHSDQRLHYPEAINLGVSKTKDTDLLLLNDDCILTENALENMVMGLGKNEIILNATSNCDNHYAYSLIMGYEDNEFRHLQKRFYRYDELAPIVDKLITAKSIYPPGFIQREFVCFYATIIPRSVWNKVGELDSNFKTGQDDVDYCRRAKKMGVSCGVALNALIWHFGGVSADQCLDDKTRNTNIEYYKSKWGDYPP